MTINERIRLLRKKKGLNQKQFASLLGITQSGASYMEQSGNNVSDSSIKAICSMCNVNEDWLRNGNEPMFVEPDTFSLDEFVKQQGATDLELQLVKAYFDLDPNTRKVLVEFFRKGLVTSNTSENTNTKSIDKLEEEYKKSVLKPVSKKASTAMNTTSDT